MVRNKYILFLFRLLVGGLFIWAGTLKIVDPLGFAQSIKNYRFFPQEVCFLLAIILPSIEIVTGAFLISGLFRRTSSLLISLMLVGFIMLVVLALVRGIDTDCGCFGSLSRKADLKLILADSLFLYMALSVFWAKPRPS